MSETDPIRAKIAAEQKELQNYRGRRLRACRAAEDLHAIIQALGADDGTHLPPVTDPRVKDQPPLPAAPSAMQKAELQNMTANLLRMILLWNDGGVSPAKLPRY